uniref:Dienelactone hydrolase domain-containing protein n=1 Tax=Zooxanthella nutricula TaxID=1333877 RepID=A0A7S2P5J8_9DINO
MSCCPPGAAGYLAADHTDEGSVRSIDGVSFYQVGSGPNGLLLIPDVWGWNGGRTRALADDLAKKGLSVWVPKILQPMFEAGTDGDGLPPTFDVTVRGGELGPLVKGDWGHEKVMPKVRAIVKAMKSNGVTKMGLVGFCYGAWVGMYAAKEFDLVGCASPHPSVHLEAAVGGDAAALAKGSKCPWALFPAGDPKAGGDGDMYDAEGDVFKALEEKFSGKCVTKRFPAMKHGWVSRGAIKEGQFMAGSGEDVKGAVTECIMDICEFFVKRGLMRRNKAGLPPPPIKLRAPKFTKVGKIEPEAKSLNLVLKAVKIEETAPGKAWDAVLGDETGVVTLSLRSAQHAADCKPGASVRIQNARVLMIKGYVRIIVDKWAVLKPADAPLECEPKTGNDISATEYELA